MFASQSISVRSKTSPSVHTLGNVVDELLLLRRQRLGGLLLLLLVVVVVMVVVVMGKSNLVREKREKGSSFNPEFAPLCPGYTGWGGEEEKPRRKWEKTTLLPNNR